MVGSIIGNVVGSVFQSAPTKCKGFKLFRTYNRTTYDAETLTKVFSALEKCKGNYKNLKKIAFKEITGEELGKDNRILNDDYPYFENNVIIRVSPVAYFAESLEQCKELTKIVTGIRNNNPDVAKGGEAVAVATYLALHGSNKLEIKKHINDNYYELKDNCNVIRKNFFYNSSQLEYVPKSIQAFIDSTCYEDAIRIAVSLGGRAEILAAITGGIAEAYYGIPEIIENNSYRCVDYSIRKFYPAMIEKRNELLNKYIFRRVPPRNEMGYSRTVGSDMDGMPDNFQRNAQIKHKEIVYKSGRGNAFGVHNRETGETRRMNNEDFYFFMDLLRERLYARYGFRVTSIEDYYGDLFLEMSMDYWREKDDRCYNR